MASFIENINNVAAKLDIIVEANTIFDDGVVPVLEEIAALDLSEAIVDLKKGTFFGNRKIDIDLSLNKQGIVEGMSTAAAMEIWEDTATTVYYSGATVTFVDGVVISVPFVNDDLSPINISNHGTLVYQLLNNAAFTAKLTETGIFDDIGGETGVLVRIYDIVGQTSNIERIQLHAVAGAYVDQNPVYFWGKTTSAFQTLSMRTADIIKLGNDIDSIILLANRITEMLALQERIPELVTNVDSLYANIAKLVAIHAVIGAITNVHTNMAKIQNIDTNMANLNEIVTSIIPNLAEILNADTNAATATAQAVIATTGANTATAQAVIATTQAGIATTKSNEIKNVSVGTTITGAAGTAAAVIYNPLDGKFSFAIPQGVKGDKGDAFAVNAQGLFSIRSTFDAQPQNFSFVATDLGLLYFKNSNTSGDWSLGIPFGKGDKGDTGAAGNGILGIVFLSTTDASGLAGKSGATDTYRITYTDTTTDDFVVYNGQDAGDASTISFVPNGDIAATNVQAAIQEVRDDADTKLGNKADKSDTYTKSETDTALASKLSLSGGTLTGNLTTKSITETVYSLTGTEISALNGSIQEKVLSGNTTLTETLTSGQSVTLHITIGANTLTFPTLTWVGGTPTIAKTGVSIFELWKTGTTLRGAYIGEA